MALPTKEKTWNAIVARVNGTGNHLENHRRILFAVKAAFLTAGWTVIRSCDKVTVDASDLWVDWEDVNWVSGGDFKHSWIVLQAPAAMHSSLQVLLSGYTNSYNTPEYITAKYSFDAAGFDTGGTTAADPTAIASVTLKSGLINQDSGRWFINTTSPTANFAMNFAYSSDGTSVRCFFCVNGSIASFFSFNRAEDLIGGAYWGTDPVVVGWPYLARYSHVNDAAGFTANLNGTPISAVGATLGWGSAMNGQNHNFQEEIGGGGYPIDDIYYIATTAGSRGRFGRAIDMFYGAPSVSNGSTFPDDVGETRHFAQFGQDQ